MAVFFAVFIGLGYVMSQAYGDSSFVYIAVGFSFIMNFVGYWYSDKIALASSRAIPIAKQDNPELWNIVENLSITAGLPMPKLYLIPDPAPNAFATGRNKEHASVAVTAGLLQILNRSELEGVIAHELSHIGNRDILLSTVVVVLVGSIALLSDMFRRMSFFGGMGRRNNDREGGEAQGIFMIVALVLSILAPIAAVLIQLAISRKREFLADADGALLTRYPEGLASALEKISQYGRPMLHASNATAHLFISNPFGSKGSLRGSISGLFMTHPPVEQRIEALLDKKTQV